MKFTTRTLGSICDEVGGTIRTGPFGSQLHEYDYKDEGVPVVMPKDIIQGRVSEGSIARIDDDTVTRLYQHKLRVGDIVYGRRGDIGRRALIAEREAGWLCGTGCLRISLGDSVLDPAFLYYFLGEPSVVASIAGQAIGATMLNLNTTIFRSVPISYPQLPEQRKIAAILSAYDNLIVNNQQRIHLLEEMAATVYREWFVHFRFPGHENVEMCQSPLGQIPKGWLGRFADYVDFLEGPGLRKWEFQEEGIPFLIVRSLIANDIDLSKVKYIDPELVRRKYSHFLLEPLDHVVSSSATLGRVVTIQSHHLPLLLNTGIIRMRPKTDAVGRWQLKHFFNSDYFQNQIRGYAVGVAQIHYGPSHLKRMLIVAPNDDIGKQYEALTAPIEELIAKLVRANTSLRQTRDLLLPKLISGDLDVEHLDINTEALDE